MISDTRIHAQGIRDSIGLEATETHTAPRTVTTLAH